MVYIFFKFLVLYNDILDVFRGETVPNKAKITKSWYKIFLLKHIVQFRTSKNCISKLCIKMFIQNQSSKGLCLPNAWVLRLYYLNFKPDNCVRCEAAFIGHNSILLQDIVPCLVIIVRLDQMLLYVMKYH